MAADDPQSKHGKTTVAGAVSPSATKKPKESLDRVPVKPELTEINHILMCSLCSGYLIEATAISECQHTFCKSCILKYLETNGYCPICDIGLNTVKPHLSLRSDVIVQRLVYKLVPGLLVSELKRRREHAEKKGNATSADAISKELAVEVDAASDLSTILSLDAPVSLSIEYFESKENEPQATIQPKQDTNNTVNNVHGIQDVDLSKTEANDRRFLRFLKCPAAVSVGLLKKFIRRKFDLSDDYRVDLLYNGNRDNSLENELTLLDLAFIYKWNKDEPMRFHYQIFDRNAKGITPRPGTKRLASSMMDDPPDDDAQSGGPPNRPQMTSGPPSSKFPRMSNNTSTGAKQNSGGNTGGSFRSTNLSSSTPVYDFSEGNSDLEEPMQKGKLKLRPFRSSSSSNSNDKSGSQVGKKSPSNARSLSKSESYEDKAIESGRSESASVNRRSSGTNTSFISGRGRSSSIGTPGDESEDGESDSSTDSDEDAKNTDLTNSRVRSAAQQVMQSQVNGIKLNLSNLEKREPLKLSLGSVLAKSPEHKHKHKHHKMKHKKKHKPLKISLSFPPSNTTHVNSNINQSQNNHKSNKMVKVSGEKGTKLVFGLAGSKSTEGKGSGNGSSGSTNSQSNFPVNVKPTTSAHLSNISKSISVSIGVGNNNQQQNKPTQFSNKAAATTTPTNLIPKNAGLEIQATTMPLNAQHPNSSSSTSAYPNQSSRSHPLLPESVHVPKSVTLTPIPPNPPGGRGNNSNNNAILEKGSSNPSNRPNNNSHPFSHPIINKSLHQITVTEVPPPPKPGSNSPASSGSANNSNTTNLPSSNPIEKVIANAANKPQFNGPGSMEITKIYCGTKDTNTAKKLKERKGLDISITVPGMKDNKNSLNKLEETLRQKIGSSMTVNNKIKGNVQHSQQTPFFNAKMPPGITIHNTMGGSPGMNKTTSNNSSSNSANPSPNNTIHGLGFTLPPHITAHPQQTPKHIVNQMKQGEKPNANKNMASNKNRIISNKVTKDSTNPSKAITNNNKGFENRKQLGEALASMIDMANRNAMKSPSPPKNCQMNKEQHKNSVKTTGNINCEKRVLDMSSSSRKNSRDSPEPKRSKANNNNNNNNNDSKSSSSTTSSESPLDLSGRSSRPNSNSSSPIHHNTNNNKQIQSSPNNADKLKHNNINTEPTSHSFSNTSQRKSPTSLVIPKVSPSNSTATTIAPGFLSPSNSSGKSSQKATTPNSSSPSILSIAQSLAQKQLLSQQQQQQQQNLHNQIMQLHQGLQNLHQSQSSPGGKHSVGNSLSPKGSNNSSLGLNSLSPPIISMPNSSPPNTSFHDPLRNLLTLNDPTVARHGKVPLSLMAAAGLGLCPPHPHHPGLSLPSPTSGVAPGGIFSHLTKSSGMLDPGTQAYLAAISAAHNERLAAAAGMGHFGDSTMSLANSFYSQQQQQVRPPSSNAHGSLRVTPKSSSANNSGSNKTPPLPFTATHPPTNAPHSPNKPRSESPVSISSVSSSSHSKPMDSSSVGIKNTKINGTSSSYNNHLSLLPPGLKNPLLPNFNSRPATNNLIPGGNANSTSSKVSGSSFDSKKGIPNSMKISNFLPSKPKDGKNMDSSNVEATITSGSNVGGSSLAKFLNSIPPLIVSQASSNLSVSSSTLPKEGSSRAFNTLNNKSNNEQESSATKSNKSLLSPSSSSLIHNPIKRESCSDKPIISSTGPLKSNSDLITCQTTPKVSSKINSDAVNSVEIKSEGNSLVEKKVAVVGISSPPLSGRGSHQPQNQAVRHIPNPSLLFNRQQQQTHATSPSSENISGKSLSLAMKLDENSLQIVPALPFPGVSVPVQVKVDHDAIPIPISVEEPKPEECENNEVDAVDRKPVIISPTAAFDITPNAEESTNEICKKEEEIVKIECEDGDVDIDVGIEATPVFSTNDDDKTEQKSETAVAESQVQINIASKNEFNSELISSREIQTKEKVSQDDDIKSTSHSPLKLEVEEEKESSQVGKEREIEVSEDPTVTERQIETETENSESVAIEENETFPSSSPLLSLNDEPMEVEEEKTQQELAKESDAVVKMLGEENVMECEDTEPIQPQPEAQNMEIEGESTEVNNILENIATSAKEEQESTSSEMMQECLANQIIINQPTTTSTEMMQEAEEFESVAIPEAETKDSIAESASCDDTEINNTASELHISSNTEEQMQTEDLELVSDSNLISNQIVINPEALQVVDTSIMEITNEPVVNKETLDEPQSVNSLNNAKEEGEQRMEESLIESSLNSQLELNCPSADPNGIELSNPVTIDQAEACEKNQAEEEEGDKKCDGDTETQQLFELESDKSEIPSNSTLEVSSLAPNVENNETEGNYQNIKDIPEEESLSENSIRGEESASETPTALSESKVDPLFGTMNDMSSPTLGEMMMTTSPDQIQSGESQDLMFASSGEADADCNPSFISATATITTEENSLLESPVSSRNSLESPNSPVDEIKKIESLEKVAAGLFATNTINNNNNTSLTISAPTITTTTSANDMTTV